MTITALWPLLRRFWPALPIIALALALLATRATLADVKANRDAVQASFESTVAGYRAAAAERKAADYQNVERVKVESAAINERTVDDYQNNLLALRADFAERVRVATAAAHPGSTGGADLPAIPDAAGRADACPVEAQLPAQDALIASEQAEQLVALQRWVRDAGAIEVNGETATP